MLPLLLQLLLRFLVEWIKRKFPSSPPEPASRKLTGRVLSHTTNDGIEGAQVILESGGAPLNRRTDANGYFFFSFQSPIDSIRICVDANGYERSDQLINLSDTQEITRDVRLSPTSQLVPVARNRTLIGRVVNDRNSGIQGARVILEAQGAPQVKQTDAYGYFLFSFQSVKDTVHVIVESNNYLGSDTLVPLTNGDDLETRVTISFTSRLV